MHAKHTRTDTVQAGECAIQELLTQHRCKLAATYKSIPVTHTQNDQHTNPALFAARLPNRHNLPSRLTPAPQSRADRCVHDRHYGAASTTIRMLFAGAPSRADRQAKGSDMTQSQPELRHMGALPMLRTCVDCGVPGLCVSHSCLCGCSGSRVVCPLCQLDIHGSHVLVNRAGQEVCPAVHGIRPIASHRNLPALLCARPHR